MMTDTEVHVKLLDGLKDDLKKVFLQSTSVKVFESGEAIIWQGDECEAVYCILSGGVEIYRLSPGGREQILDRMNPGGCFNLVPALSGDGKNQANVRALTRSKLLEISKTSFLQLLRHHPEFSLAVNHFFAERLAHMTRLVETLSLYPVRQRLAMFLIDQADTTFRVDALRWTQTDIARRLGTVRDVLGRTLRKLEEEGILRIEREKILLLDRKRLEQVAEGQE